MTTESHEHPAAAGRVEPAPAISPVPPRRLVFLRAGVLAAVGLGAAVLAEAAISQIGEVFKLPPDLVALGVGQIPGGEDQQRITAGNVVLQYQHAALWLGMAGAILGGLFGVTLGMFRRARSSALQGLAAGALLGGLSGSLAGPLAVSIDRTQQANIPEGQLAVSDSRLMLMHGATWLVAGLGCGLGAGLGSPVRRGRTAAGMMMVAGVAGSVGGALYLVIAGAVLPLANASSPIPDEGWSRLLWLALPGVIMGIAMGCKSSETG